MIATIDDALYFRLLGKRSQIDSIGTLNFLLNLHIVVADFGTTAFNQQVARVDAITRVGLAIPEFIGFWAAVMSVRRAMYSYLPEENDEEEDDSDFWDLLALREAQRIESSQNIQGGAQLKQ